MGIYDRQIAQVLRIIKKKGKLVTWHKQSVTISGSQPWKSTSAAPQTYPVSIVFLSSGTSVIDALFHLIKGTSVPDGAPRGLMGTVPFVPAVNDTFDDGTITFTVKSIDIVEPNGTPILYKIRFA